MRPAMVGYLDRIESLVTGLEGCGTGAYMPGRSVYWAPCAVLMFTLFVGATISGATKPPGGLAASAADLSSQRRSRSQSFGLNTHDSCT